MSGSKTESISEKWKDAKVSAAEKYDMIGEEEKELIVISGVIDILENVGILVGGGGDPFLTSDGRMIFDMAMRDKIRPEAGNVVKHVMSIVHRDTPFDVCLQVCVLAPLVYNNTVFDFASWTDDEQTDFMMSQIKHYIRNDKLPDWLKLRIDEDGNVVTDLDINQVAGDSEGDDDSEEWPDDWSE